METRYARIGTIDFGLLEEADYAVKERGRCDLIFQEQIPDEELSEIVYERRADPDKAYLHREKRALAGRGRNALEVMSIVDFFGRRPEELQLLDFGMGWGFWGSPGRSAARPTGSRSPPPASTMPRNTAWRP